MAAETDRLTKNSRKSNSEIDNNLKTEIRETFGRGWQE